MRKRNIGFLLWLTEEEMEKFSKRAKKSGLSKQQYARDRINNYEPKSLPPLDFFSVMKQLDQINHNMNQIAVKAHTLNFIDAPLYEENSEDLQKVIAEIMRQVYG